MIKLFPSTETAFATNGLGALPDAVSCTVTEERNGAYEMAMEYPITGLHYEEIQQQSIITVKPNPVDGPQPFRIYQVTRPMGGIVTVYAEHISYDLSGVPLIPFTADSAAAAMAGLEANAAIPSRFAFWTDKTTAANFAVKAPSSTRAVLGGVQGSILDVYGGEYEFDRFTVKLHSARGTDRGVTIRYGKNLTSLEQEENCASVYTGVYPYHMDADGNLTQLPERIVYAPGTYPLQRILPLDLSGEWEESPTITKLRAAAESYIKRNDIGVPRVSLKVSFAQLEQSEEYRDKALLERVSLCDTVQVIFPALGVSAAAKCVKTTYNALLNKYESVELGDARTSIADTIAAQQQAIKTAEEQMGTAFQAAINTATALITGNKGGYVVLHSSTGAKTPDEILIMDEPEINDAVKIWRWNKGGLGYSKTGYNGPYGTAITQDGAIVADYITSGGMNAARITAGVLTSNDGKVQFDLSAGTLTVKDSTGTIRLGFDTANNLTVRGTVYASGGSFTGTITAGEGALGGWTINANGLWYGGTAASPTYYLGHTGLTASIAGASRRNIIFKAGSGFGVDTSGNLYANNATLVGGTFSGNLSAAGGTFSGNLSAAGGTFSGNLSAAGGTFSGNLSAAGGTFSGNLSAVGGSFEELDAVGGRIHLGMDYIDVNGVEIGYVPQGYDVSVIPSVTGGYGNLGIYNNFWDQVKANNFADASSQKYKIKIRTLTDEDVGNLEEIRPVTYELKAKKDGVRHIGIIAEELAPIIPSIVEYDEDGEPDSISYSRLAVVAIYELQKVRNRMRELELKVAELEEKCSK